MKEETFKINGLEAHKIFVVSWLPDRMEDIKGVVQIVHGMAEHCLRYRDFATFLTNNGYGVYAHDHRGHGQSLDQEEDLGFFHEERGWDYVVEEVQLVTSYIKEQHPKEDIFILGHSMGSLITRDYIQRYGNMVKGTILSGTSDTKGILGKIGLLIAKAICSRKGPRHYSPLLTQLSFGNFNKKFSPNRTEYDWISRDKKQVDCYVNDDRCGFVCTAKFYSDILEGLERISNKENIKKTPKTLPLFIISGTKDPVGNMGKGVTKVSKNYISNGYRVQVKLYNEGRHEILNETNYMEVYMDILKFIESV